ncbi:olfactory receptor 13D1-like [Nerophis ophidion]|uniref:olfactory receptor 13D1-like n=1 Tax=Nerophis ophidion TaxID=159077 RepID=UPI002ADF8FFC|nr:olfactory receptor 13D1-like [Nerophis ophidion]XP_061775415.1 olfactory receptor 13D1-like [Nerophis ophidion]
MTNVTVLTFFYLTGLSHMTTKLRLLLFCATLLCYGAILLVNGVLIVTIVLEKKLHEPMYVFVCNLCVNSLYGTAAFYPKFLYDLLSDRHMISYFGCMLQLYVIYSYAATEFSILAVMAYDRCVAICRPLEYHAIMTKTWVVFLVAFSRLVPLFSQGISWVLTSKLQLCGSHIRKLYCENWSILTLSCNSIATNSTVGFIVIMFYVGYDIFIFCSYIQLIKLALRSKEGKKKFSQTCVPHLLCLLNVTVALLFDLMYTRYGSKSVDQNVSNFMAIQFLMIPPLLNPIIYGLKISRVRNNILKYFTKKMVV